MAETSNLDVGIQTIGVVVGVVYGAVLFLVFDWDLSSSEERVNLVWYCVVPIILMALLVTYAKIGFVAAKVENTVSRIVTNAFVACAGGIEIAYFLFAWSILKRWLSSPDKDYLEPLFVAIGVAIAVLEYMRKMVQDMD